MQYNTNEVLSKVPEVMPPRWLGTQPASDFGRHLRFCTFHAFLRAKLYILSMLLVRIVGTALYMVGA